MVYRSRVRVLSLLLLVLGCSSGHAPRAAASSPGIVFPTAIGEGKGDGAAATLPAPSSAARDSAPSASSAAAGAAPPDPEPLRLREQWEYELVWDAGELRVASVRAREFPSPIVSARRMGRYALELWIGAELVERVRFDFPLLALASAASADRRQSLSAPIEIDRGAHVTQRVLVPASPRARRAHIVDRATSKVLVLTWPPTPIEAPVGERRATPAAGGDGKRQLGAREATP